MNRVELQRALYNARNAYLKAKKEMEFQKREISFLNECVANLDKPKDWLFNEMFGDTPIAEEVYGG